MSEVRDAAINFEAKKIALKQDKNGTIITLVIHHDDTEKVKELWDTATGQRYMVAMVGLTDEEQPIPTREGEAGTKAVQSAGILCRDPAFQAFVGQRLDTFITDHDACGKQLCGLLGVQSRSELKDDEDARDAFIRIRAEFNAAS